jgi:hypothetical protein
MPRKTYARGHPSRPAATTAVRPPHITCSCHSHRCSHRWSHSHLRQACSQSYLGTSIWIWMRYSKVCMLRYSTRLFGWVDKAGELMHMCLYMNAVCVCLVLYDDMLVECRMSALVTVLLHWVYRAMTYVVHLRCYQSLVTSS